MFFFPGQMILVKGKHFRCRKIALLELFYQFKVQTLAFLSGFKLEKKCRQVDITEIQFGIFLGFISQQGAVK